MGGIHSQYPCSMSGRAVRSLPSVNRPAPRRVGVVSGYYIWEPLLRDQHLQQQASQQSPWQKQEAANALPAADE